MRDVIFIILILAALTWGIAECLGPSIHTAATQVQVRP